MRYGECMPLTTPTTQTTITELLLDRPARARLFQKLGIDFCCGGKLSLEDACRRKSLNPETTLEALLIEDRAGIREPIESMTLALQDRSALDALAAS
jgi:iron-sulfur cluster repair protein YtfE (RIC family)